MNSHLKATYFQEPVDQFSCVERAWRAQLQDENPHNVIFLRSRPGRWSSQPEVWSIKYTLDGDCSFELGGHECEVFPGFCFVIPEGQDYRSTIHDGTALSVFGRPLAGAAVGDAPGVFGVFPLDRSERALLRQRVEALRATMPATQSAQPDQGQEIYLEATFPLPRSWRRLAREIDFWNRGSRAQQRAAQRLLMARHFLTSGFREHDICTRAADVANMTRSHFSRQFSALFGQSPRQYVVAYRGAVAQSLLRCGRHSVEQVSGLLGYGHASSLAHLFQRQNLRNPRSIRSSARRGDSR